jgi:hypothetical protein
MYARMASTLTDNLPSEVAAHLLNPTRFGAQENRPDIMLVLIR